MICKRAQRVRYKIRLHAGNKFRLSVFRSLKHVYVQLIDDTLGVTLLSATSNSKNIAKNMNKMAKSLIVGKEIAEKMLKQNINTAVLDRGPYAYHGVVRALADAIRENGVII